MKNWIADKLKTERAAFIAPLRFVVYPVLFILPALIFTVPGRAAVPKADGIYQISDDLAAGNSGSVDLAGGAVILSGSLGQVAVSLSGAGGREVESGYFSKYVSAPASLGYSGIYYSSVSVTGSDAASPNPSGTVYETQISTAPDFSGAVIYSSSTAWPVSLAGLARGATYYTRVRALYMGEDASPYTSLQPFLTLADPGGEPLTAVSDLRAQAGNVVGEFALSWSAPGNDGSSGTLVAVSAYHIQYATYPSVSWSTSAAQISVAISRVDPGTMQNHLVSGLRPNTIYYFRLWTMDDAGNYSQISNEAAAVTGIEAPTNIYFDEISTTSIVASAYAPTPAFSNLHLGVSGTNVGILAGSWNWAGWRGEKWTSKAPMPTARGWAAAAAVGDKIYILGGAPALSTNERYDPVTDTWETRQNGWTGRRGLAAAVTGGKIYALGEIRPYWTSGINEEYDPITGSWLLRQGKSSAYNLAAATVRGRIYAFGGTRVAMATPVCVRVCYTVGCGGSTYCPTVSTQLNSNEEYDSVSNTWALRQPMPSARAGLAAAVVGDKIYALGGLGGPLKANEEYDPASDIWRTRSEMPTAREYLAAAAVGGKIYAFGGLSNVIVFNTTEEYDPIADIWAEKKSMPTARGKLMAAAVGGKIYVVGGSNPTSYLQTNEEYDPGVAAKFTFLTPNTLYTFKAKARNQYGNETNESPIVSTYTLAAVSLPQDNGSPFTAVSSYSVTVRWSSGTISGGFNGPGAFYRIDASTSFNFSAAVTAYFSGFNATEAFVDGLKEESTYYFRIKAANVLGVWGDYLYLGATETISGPDVLPPSVVIHQPADGQRFRALALITGTASDNYNARYPQIRLHDSVLNKYWKDGSGFCGEVALPGWVGPACADFPEVWNVANGSSSAKGSFSWSYNSSTVSWPERDNGLRVDAKVSDEAGNYVITSPTFSFDATPPVSRIEYPSAALAGYSSMTVISGTSMDLTSAIADVQISMWYLNGDTTYYWSPTAPHWVNSEAVWWSVSGAAGPKGVINTWSYTNSDFATPGTTSYAWNEGVNNSLSGTTFYMISRAVDAAGNQEIAHAASSFVFKKPLVPANKFTLMVRRNTRDPGGPVLSGEQGVTLIIKAQNAEGVTVPRYNGTVEFYIDGVPGGPEYMDDDEVVDDIHGLPQTYTFTGEDYGIKTFDIRLRKPGDIRTLIVQDKNTPSVGGSTTVAVVATGLSGIPKGDVIGISSITWSWTPAVYASSYTVYQGVGTAAPIGIVDNVLFVQTGLIPNTTYSIVVAGLNAYGEGPVSLPAAPICTLATPPVETRAIALSSASVKVLWSSDANPFGTNFEISYSSTGAFVPDRHISIATITVKNSFIISNLLSYTTYYFRVRAFNGNGVPTVFAPVVATRTLPPVPTVPLLSTVAVGVSSIVWTWGNVIYAEGYRIISPTGINLSGDLAGSAVSRGETGLLPNTSYARQVVAFNISGASTSPVLTRYTLAAPPSAVSAVALSSSSINVSWNRSLNSLGTNFEVAYSSVSDLAGTSAIDSVPFTTGDSLVLSGLLPYTSYYVRVRALNGDGITTEFVFAAPVRTSRPLPSIPSLLAGTVGISSISWTWVGVPYAEGYRVTSSSGIDLSGELPQDRSSWIETGLLANTQYVRRVIASNTSGASGSNTVARYTLAHPPDNFSAVAIHITSVSLNWGLNNNPAGTLAELSRSRDGITYNTLMSTGATSFQDAALESCATYYYKIRNFNGEAIPTSYAGPIPVLTRGVAPGPASGFTAAPLFGRRISLNWLPSPGPGLAYYHLYSDEGRGIVDYSSPIAVLSSTSTAYVTAVLVSSPSYIFALRAADRCGTEEDNVRVIASAPAVNSLAGVRASIKEPHNGKKVAGNRLSVIAEIILGELFQVSEMRFQWKASASPVWVDMTPTDSNHPNPDSRAPYFVHWDVSRFASGNYDLRAVASDIDGNADAAAPSITITVDNDDFEVKENHQYDGKVKKQQVINNTVPSVVQSADVERAWVTKVDIPSEAVNASTVTLSIISNPSGSPVQDARLNPIGQVAEINLSNSQHLLSNGQAAEIELTYPDVDGDGLVDGTAHRAEDLKIYSYDALTMRWKDDLTNSVDQEHHKVTGRTRHFSYFAVFAPVAVNINTACKMYPNPWKPGSGGMFDAGGVTFANLDTGGTVRIFTIAGELVRELDVSAADARVKVWDGKNSSGSKVASGVYIVRASFNGINKSLKLAVER